MTRLSPLFRSTVGFDRMMNLLESTASVGEEGYPPYNIEKVSDDDYRITMAVAGFGEDDLEIEAKANALVVSGKVTQTTDEGRSFLYRGIAGRSFRRSFQLADHVKVKGAHLENGLLHIDLVREIPEEMKPRTIAIRSGGEPRQIEADKQAA
ncbi:MAG: Hsp20 family protein [Proteobacteria bacterium]|nr:Hsp20 family protein [Pseudomonadota bacterium]MDA1070013.1 Hsp20 family protein [Pseudomonadota bacterium]